MISVYASLQTLHFLALTKTWIAQENTATPAALSFSLSPIQIGRGRETGLLIYPMWCYQVLPLDHLLRSAFEFHTVSVTLPFKLNIVVIYHPPNCSPGDGTLLVVMGDFNFYPEKLCPSEFNNFFSTFAELTLMFHRGFGISRSTMK